MTLEELIRDRAKKGLLTHLSVWPDHKTKGWGASCATSQFHHPTVEFDADPVTAAVKAIEAMPQKRVRSKLDDPRRENKSEPEPQAEDAGGSAEDTQADASTDWFRQAGS